MSLLYGAALIAAFMLGAVTLRALQLIAARRRYWQMRRRFEAATRNGKTAVILPPWQAGGAR